jgi:hypothetical protein
MGIPPVKKERERKKRKQRKMVGTVPALRG